MNDVKEKKKIGLTTQIFIALILGAILGIILNMFAADVDFVQNVFVNGIFYIVGQGFIAIAAVIFGKFKPQGAMLGCILFGFCNGLRVVLGSDAKISFTLFEKAVNIPIPVNIISMIPYVVTIITLVLFVGRARGPAANGKPYIKSK